MLGKFSRVISTNYFLTFEPFKGARDSTYLYAFEYEFIGFFIHLFLVFHASSCFTTRSKLSSFRLLWKVFIQLSVGKQSIFIPTVLRLENPQEKKENQNKNKRKIGEAEKVVNY